MPVPRLCLVVIRRCGGDYFFLNSYGIIGWLTMAHSGSDRSHRTLLPIKEGQNLQHAHRQGIPVIARITETETVFLELL